MEGSSAATPDIRAAWHEALAALGPADGPDVRGMPDGMLWHLRDTYPIETAWALKWVGATGVKVSATVSNSLTESPARPRSDRPRPR